MKARFIYLFGAILTTFVVESQAQEVTSSLSDDLGKATVTKDISPTLSFNKKVKLTNTENGKSVVVRINDRIITEENSKIAGVSKKALDEIGVTSNKTKVKVQELQADDEVERFWATANASTSKAVSIAPAFKNTVKEKEVEVETTNLSDFDVNHVYDLNGKAQELRGFGLQLAAFNNLKFARDFAFKLAKNSETEVDRVYIQVSKSADKAMVYRVVYGLFEDVNVAKDSQKKIENLGYNAFVKGF